MMCDFMCDSVANYRSYCLQVYKMPITLIVEVIVLMQLLHAGSSIPLSGS